jgi:hypothetical protein
MQIRVACHGLLRSYNITDEKTTKNCLYNLFYPLLRYGLVEFIGKGNYQISSPLFILNRDSSDYRYAAINLNKFQLEDLKQTASTTGFHTDIFQIARFSGTRSTIMEFSGKNQIPIQNNRIYKILSQIPSILDIVGSFEKCYPDSNGFYHSNLDDFEWKKVKNELKPGLYKASAEDYSQRYFRCADNTWKRVPLMEENLDSSNIARCAQGILENKKFLFYDPVKKQLVNKNIFLPILIDRILRIPSYHLTDGAIQMNGATVYNNLTMSDYKKLNRIFCNTVEVIR